jgi:hypothetical protein
MSFLRTNSKTKHDRFERPHDAIRKRNAGKVPNALVVLRTDAEIATFLAEIDGEQQ